MNPNATMAIQEAMRRRANLGASGAGIQGGMQATQSPSPMNPMAQQQVNTQPSVSSPTGGMIGAMQDSNGGEAQTIIKALIKRLGDLGSKIPQPEAV